MFFGFFLNIHMFNLIVSKKLIYISIFNAKDTTKLIS